MKYNTIELDSSLKRAIKQSFSGELFVHMDETSRRYIGADPLAVDILFALGLIKHDPVSKTMNRLILTETGSHVYDRLYFK